MDNRECLILIRGQKPLKGLKIIPDELSDHRRLKYSRVADYIPKWRKHEEETEIHKEEYIPTDSTEEPVTPPNCENNKGAEQLSFIDNEPRVEFEPDDSDDMPETTSASSLEKFTQTTSNEILNN